NYLKPVYRSINVDKPKILWWCESSRKTATGVKIVEKKIDWIASKFGRTYILFWHSTCDITNKQGKCIYQNYKWTEELIAEQTENFNKLLELNDKHRNVKIGILETPPVFTKQWNRSRGSDFAEEIDDGPIHEQVKQLNCLIRMFNDKLGFCAPKFECDFIHSRRKAKNSKHVSNETRYRFTSLLLADGVHPINIVAKKWIIKILHLFLFEASEGVSVGHQHCPTTVSRAETTHSFLKSVE
ncbi:MAG: hypothetical protein ABW185_11655, partial [Sedimenticola sp.]